MREFSDPDKLALEDGSFRLYVSSGANTLLYVSENLDGEFAIPEGGDKPFFVSEHQGVPSAIQDVTSKEIWLYVHSHVPGTGTVIRRAVGSEIETHRPEDFETVLEKNIFKNGQFADGEGVFSPSIVLWE